MKAHVDLASRGRYQHPMRIVGRVLAFANLMLLRKMAGAGWSCAAVAQYNLGLMYANGRGVPKDDAEAVKWLRKAAEKGVDESQYNLGLMYANGRGVPKDDATAVRLYRKAAENGIAGAEYNLGLMYANGRGVPKDDAEAVKWLRKAAEKGVDESQYELGLMYANGRGVPKDDATAYQWYLLAVAQGNEEARKGMDDMEKLLTPEQRAEGQRMAREFKAKARSLEWTATLPKGWCEDYQMYCLTRIQGNAELYQWYLLAVAQGNEEARKGMDDMEKLLTPEQRAEGQRMAREFKAKESK